METTSNLPRQTEAAPEREPAKEGSPPNQEKTAPQQWAWLEASHGKLGAGLLFGVIFGFLLQKGGVAKFDILVGVLLLENFVVVKVMLSAIIVGMVGSYLLRRMGVIELQINETKYASNILGGLVFGVGFGLLAYCPGTDAAALGQGNFDALIGIAGLILGSYIYALSSKYSSGTVSRWGQRGKLTLPELIGLRSGVVIAMVVPLLVGVLGILEFLGY